MRIYILVLVITIAYIGCNSSMDVVGTWRSKKENCSIHLNIDSTFTVDNLPLDVKNNYFLKEKNSYTISGSGNWEYLGKEIKLNFSNNEYYHIKISDPNLYIQLADESGGDIIFFSKK